MLTLILTNTAHGRYSNGSIFKPPFKYWSSIWTTILISVYSTFHKENTGTFVLTTIWKWCHNAERTHRGLIYCTFCVSINNSVVPVEFHYSSFEQVLINIRYSNMLSLASSIDQHLIQQQCSWSCLQYIWHNSRF